MHSKHIDTTDLARPNIFLSKAEGGHAKLGDFGLSTELVGTLALPNRFILFDICRVAYSTLVCNI